jgi:hypothetical protein
MYGRRSEGKKCFRPAEPRLRYQPKHLRSPLGQITGTGCPTVQIEPYQNQDLRNRVQPALGRDSDSRIAAASNIVAMTSGCGMVWPFGIGSALSSYATSPNRRSDAPVLPPDGMLCLRSEPQFYYSRCACPCLSPPRHVDPDLGLAQISTGSWVGRDLQEASNLRSKTVSDPQSFPIEKIRVPEMKRKSLKPEVVQDIAGSILDIGQQDAILVRREKDHFVLVEGLHRLEACKALGERAIIGRLISAEAARQTPHPSQAADAERQKMERLRKLRLEKEAAELAETSRTASQAEAATHKREHPNKTVGSNLIAASKQSRSAHSGSTLRTLSDWIKQQERSGGRY